MASQQQSQTATERARTPRPLFARYRTEPGAFDEFFAEDGQPREQMGDLVRRFDGLGAREFRRRKRLADTAFLKHGVTFSIYSGDEAAERIFPFDLVPRVLLAHEWEELERGLIQRIRALNAFLEDVYGEGRILMEKPLLRDIVESSRGFLRQLKGVSPPGGVYVQIAGIDLIRDGDGVFRVLEDNVRVPSGVSYVLENRAVMKRVYPAIFPQARVAPVDEYPLKLRETLSSVATHVDGMPRMVILTPGPFNSAYFEHSFLARRCGCELVQGQDLFVQDDRLYLRTTHGPEEVHVVYRRVDDQFIDPRVFRPDSLLGVPGITRAYAAGNVVLANALGNGVADDKAVYPFVPDMIRFYLSEEPALGQVETLICAREAECREVLENLSRYVVKAVEEAGGYGMLMGPQATQAELEEFRGRIRENPRGYIAQPRIELSTCPTWTGSRVEPRRVDLRPYILTGTESWVLPGGLTRVALRKGSYVVNSSQGGGSKDTWVVEATAP